MHDPVSYGRIHGSCHCGNIRVTFDRPDSGPAIPARACGCGLCTKHRAAWTSHPDGRFYLRIADESRVTQYRFGTKTADFHVCLTCGAIPIVICTIVGVRYAVFNVNTFDDIDRSELVETAMNFEGETTENRLARRRRNWTPEAVRSEGGDWLQKNVRLGRWVVYAIHVVAIIFASPWQVHPRASFEYFPEG